MIRRAAPLPRRHILAEIRDTEETHVKSLTQMVRKYNPASLAHARTHARTQVSVSNGLKDFIKGSMTCTVTLEKLKEIFQNVESLLLYASCN